MLGARAPPGLRQRCIQQLYHTGLQRNCPAPVLFPHPQDPCVSCSHIPGASGGCFRRISVGCPKAFYHVCVYVCVCAHVFRGMCRYLLACLLTCSEGEPQFVQNIFPKNLDLNLEYIWTSNHSDENRVKMSRMCRQYL